MLKPILFVMFFIIIISAVGSLESAYAATTTIDLTNTGLSCESLGGVWTNPPPTCTFSNSLTIPAGDTLIVNSGVTLQFALDKNLINEGSITNSGIISITGSSTISGFINNTKTSTFTNTGTININGGSGERTGFLVNTESATFTNSGTINLVGGSGDKSGILAVLQSSTFSNTNTIIITGSSGFKSGHMVLTLSGKFTNSGSLTINGGSGTTSGLLDNWDSGVIINSGTITITGSNGIDSGRITNMGTSSFTNTGIISLSGGSGVNSGRIINSESGNFMNSKTITITAGTGTTVPLLIKDSSKFTNMGTVTAAKNVRNHANVINFGTMTIGNNLNNQGDSVNNCGTITINGILIGNAIVESKCGNFHDTHADPTIGKTKWGLQVVENGICINITCWTVTADFHQDFELVEMLSNSIHTISTTVFCQNGVAKCNYVAFGVSPYGTNINDSVWKIILQKDHNDIWTMTVIDPDGYLGDVTSTTQIVNDGKHLGASITALFKKPTTGMILNVEVRDSNGGYRDFKFNDGIAIKDAFAYPVFETSYEEPLELEPLCLNENSNKRYTCAFDKVREWTIKNAESKLQQIINE